MAKKLTKNEIKLLKAAGHYNTYSKQVEGTHGYNFGRYFAKFVDNGWIAAREGTPFYTLTEAGRAALSGTK